MMKILHSNLRTALLVAALWLAVASAAAQGGGAVYQGQTSPLSVTPVAGQTYAWELYNQVAGINLVAVAGNCPASEAYFVGGIQTGPAVQVMWLQPGTYYAKVTISDSCSSDIQVAEIVVLPGYSTALLQPPQAVCVGDKASFTIEIQDSYGPWQVEISDGAQTWQFTVTQSPQTFVFDATPTLAGSYAYRIVKVTNIHGLVNSTPGADVSLSVMRLPVTTPITRIGP